MVFRDHSNSFPAFEPAKLATSFVGVPLKETKESGFSRGSWAMSHLLLWHLAGEFRALRLEFFETIDIDPSEAKGLLEVIDIDGNGKAAAVSGGGGARGAKGFSPGVSGEKGSPQHLWWKPCCEWIRLFWLFFGFQQANLVQSLGK